MSRNLLSFRRWERSDKTQPVFKGAVTLWEAPFYVPIGDVSRNASLSTRARGLLDVRLHTTEPTDGWPFPLLDAIVRTWSGIFDQPGTSVRSAARNGLDVRIHTTDPIDGWNIVVFSVAPTDAQIWPALAAALASGSRTPRRSLLNVLANPWPQIFGVPEDAEAWQQVGIWQLAMGADVRMRDRAKLELRGPDWSAGVGWLFLDLPAGADLLWPAILEALGLSYRANERARLDVRRYEWSPEAGWQYTAQDGTTATWAAAFRDERSYRSRPRAQLDVRGMEWSPQAGWVFSVLDATVAAWSAVWSSQLAATRADTRRPFPSWPGSDSFLGWVLGAIPSLAAVLFGPIHRTRARSDNAARRVSSGSVTRTITRIP